MNKKYWVGLIIILVILVGGIFWYLNLDFKVFQSTNNKELELKNKNDVWNFWSNENIGLSFDYLESWGVPKIYKEGDVLIEESLYSYPYTIPEGKFFIDFPLNASLYIEGFNNDYVLVDSSDDLLGYEEYTSCALNYLKHKDDSFYLYKNLKLNNPIYSVSIHEAEGRYGLFGDKILTTNKKYPSICSTLVLDRTGINTPRSKLLSQIISEKASEYVSNDGYIKAFKKVLSGEYLKALNQNTNENIVNFEKFTNSLKTF